MSITTAAAKAATSNEARMSATDERIATTETIKNESQPQPIGTYEIRNDLEMVMHLAITTPQDAYDIQRRYGKRGWRSGNAPAGGFRRPFAEAEKFDPAFIGARPGKMKNQSGVEEEGLWYRNEFYKKRQPAVNEKKGLGDMIKYSRGAKETDEDDSIEPTEGVGKGYVTLIMFKGNGPVNEAYFKEEFRKK